MAQGAAVDLETIKKGVVSILYAVGSALTAYNITAFKSDKYGVYFVDDNQLWLAIGVGMLAVGWLTRNWKKL